MKNYVKPEMQAEEFAANQVVAACGKVDGKYVFICDAPAGTLYYYDKSGSQIRLGGVHACNAKHVTDGVEDYYEGFIDYNSNKKEDANEHVLVWREKNKRGQYVDYHASKSLTRESVDVERS